MRIEDLREYEGKEVKVRLRNGKVLSGKLNLQRSVVLIVYNGGRRGSLILPQEIVEIEVIADE